MIRENFICQYKEINYVNARTFFFGDKCRQTSIKIKLNCKNFYKKGFCNFYKRVNYVPKNINKK
jgi:hypothetical protein